MPKDKGKHEDVFQKGSGALYPDEGASNYRFFVNFAQEPLLKTERDENNHFRADRRLEGSDATSANRRVHHTQLRPAPERVPGRPMEIEGLDLGLHRLGGNGGRNG